MIKIRRGRAICGVLTEHNSVLPHVHCIICLNCDALFIRYTTIKDRDHLKLVDVPDNQFSDPLLGANQDTSNRREPATIMPTE